MFWWASHGTRNSLRCCRYENWGGEWVKSLAMGEMGRGQKSALMYTISADFWFSSQWSLNLKQKVASKYEIIIGLLLKVLPVNTFRQKNRPYQYQYQQSISNSSSPIHFYSVLLALLGSHQCAIAMNLAYN